MSTWEPQCPKSVRLVWKRRSLPAPKCWPSWSCSGFGSYAVMMMFIMLMVKMSTLLVMMMSLMIVTVVPPSPSKLIMRPKERAVFREGSSLHCNGSLRNFFPKTKQQCLFFIGTRSIQCFLWFRKRPKSKWKLEESHWFFSFISQYLGCNILSKCSGKPSWPNHCNQRCPLTLDSSWSKMNLLQPKWPLL